MKNELGFEELFFIVGHDCIHYFFDGDKFWFRNSDLDIVLGLQLGMVKVRKFNPILVKGRLYTSLDECLARVSNILKPKSRTVKFILIDVFQGLAKDPYNFLPQSVSISLEPKLNENVKPKHKSRAYIIKPIDLSRFIGTKFDMQFANPHQNRWNIEMLMEIEEPSDNIYIDGHGTHYTKCKIREDHWHSVCDLKESPLPEGLIVNFRYIGSKDTVSHRRIDDYVNMDWSNVVAFCVKGVKKEYAYIWNKHAWYV